MQQQATTGPRRFLYERSPEAAQILVHVCEHGQCTYCGEQLTFKQTEVLQNRPIMVKMADRGARNCGLFLCTHCTYHHVRVIPEKHRLHWTLDGRWSKLGAPLDEQSARIFCGMLGEENLAVVVL